MTRSAYIIILSLLAMSPACLQAQNGVTVNNAKVIPVADNKIEISFITCLTKKAIRSNYSLVLKPVLTDNMHTCALRQIVVQGRNARLSEQRYRMSGGKVDMYPDAIYAYQMGTIAYQATVPYEPWMDNAQLVLQKESEGCCQITSYPSDVLLTDMQLTKLTFMIPPPVLIEEAPVLAIVQTTGDRISEQLPYVVSTSEKGQRNTQSQRTAVIYYPVTQSYPLKREFMGNDAVLDELTKAISTIRHSNDSRITKIEIVGCYSPEGQLDRNIRIALGRAATLQKYIIDHTSIGGDLFTLSYSKDNWSGLRNMVSESDMPEKVEVLNIIDHTPIWDSKRQVGRLGELMRLKNGKPYMYMLSTFFPKLRNASCIVIYYENL